MLRLLFLILGVVGAAALGARAAEMRAAIVTEQPAGTQLAVKMDGPVTHASHFALDGPRRIVIDVPGAAARNVAAGAGSVLNIRSGQFSPDTARLVLDLKEPMRIEALRFEGGELIADLAPVSPSAFSKAVTRGRVRTSFGTAAELASAAEVAVGVPEQGSSDGEAGVVRASLTRRQPAMRADTGLPLVVIDAGHGGKDPGSPGVDGLREKDVVLDIAHAIKREIEASGRARVLLTRDDDTFIPLSERPAIARRMGAQLFISVHADSFPKDPSVSGATVYTLSENASDKEAARLAHRENRSDLIAGVDLAGETDDVTSILIDLAQRETMNSSAEFAALMQRELTATGVPFKSYYHRFAGFAVLKAPDVPAVLLETGYMSNDKDAHYLASRKGQREIAEGVRRAVEAHFLRRLARY